MKKIGSLLVIVSTLFPMIFSAQCLSMEDLVGLYEQGAINGLNEYSKAGDASSIFFAGNNIQRICFKYSNASSDVLYFFKSDLVVWECSSECFTRIRSSVVKEIGGKVIDNGIINDEKFKCESFIRVGKEFIIEFNKDFVNGKNQVALLSKGRYNELTNMRERDRRQREINNQADTYLNELTAYFEAGDIYHCEKKLIIAKKYFNLNSVESGRVRELDRIDKLCKNAKLTECKKKVSSELNAQRFEQALEITRNYKSEDLDFKADVQSLQQKIISKAVQYYSDKCFEYETRKDFNGALIYIDSLLLFDKESQFGKQKRRDISTIREFILNRKNTTYAFWEVNQSGREFITNDYTQLILAQRKRNTGQAHFRLELNSDTTCEIYSKLMWISPPAEGITFENSDIRKYKLEPYSKFGYCAKSWGVIDLNVSWSSQKGRNKFFQGVITEYDKFDLNLRDYVSQNYPQLTGKATFAITEVKVNDQVNKEVAITKFRTRGPWNGVFSFFVPGSGLLVTSYGKRGYGPLILYASGIGGLASQNNSLVLLGALAISTAMIWDFSATIKLGSKNLRNSKELRTKLRNGVVVL